MWSIKTIRAVGVVVLGTMAVVLWSQAKAAETAKDKAMLRHVVLFKFKETASPAEIKKIEEEFLALRSKIDTVADLEWGTNNSPEGLAKGYTHCFLVTFADEKGRQAYLPHAAHTAFVEILKPQLEEVLVIDYWAKK